MNDFVEEEWSNMKDFLHKISVSANNVFLIVKKTMHPYLTLSSKITAKHLIQK